MAERAEGSGVTEWQPIETAPKNRHLLIFSSATGVETSFWNPSLDDWDGGLDGYGEPQALVHATHWMPLPAPPAARGCGAKLAPGQWWNFCGETDMGQTPPVLCTECGGDLKRAEQKGAALPPPPVSST